MKISGSPLLIEPEWDVEDCEAMEESRTFCSKICCAGSVRRKRVVSVIETVERTQSEAAWTVGHELGVVNNRGGCMNTHIFEVLTHFGSNGSYPGVIGTRWFPDLKRPSKIDVVARHPGEGVRHQALYGRICKIANMYKHVSELPARCAILVPHSGNFVLYSVYLFPSSLVACVISRVSPSLTAKAQLPPPSTPFSPTMHLRKMRKAVDLLRRRRMY